MALNIFALLRETTQVSFVMFNIANMNWMEQGTVVRINENSDQNSTNKCRQCKTGTYFSKIGFRWYEFNFFLLKKTSFLIGKLQ